MYPTSSCSARLWHTTGFENGCHICLSSDSSSINGLGSLGDISRKKKKSSFLYFDQGCVRGGPKGYHRYEYAQKQSVRQPIHFDIKWGYLQILNVFRVQWCLGKTNVITCLYAEHGHQNPAHVYDVLFQICIMSSFGDDLTLTIGKDSHMNITWQYSERSHPFDYLSEILQVSVQILRGAILCVFKRPWNKVTFGKVW